MAVSAITLAVSIMFVTVTTVTMAISTLIMAGGVVFVVVSTVVMTVSIVIMTVSAMSISAVTTVSVMVVASISVTIQIRIVADWFVIWLKFMKVIEGSDDVRSMKAVGSFDFGRARIVENLNCNVFLTTFVEFFVQGVIQPFRLMDTFSFVFRFC